MSEQLAAEIQIGGKIGRRVAEILCSVITAERVSLEWGDSPFEPKTVDDLLSARFDNGDGLLTLRLYDDQASWGKFDSLERFLQEHKIPFARYTEGRYDYDPEVVAFHPTGGLVQEPTSHNRNPIVQVSAIRPIADKLAAILTDVQNGEFDTARLQRRLQRLHRKLRKCLPADVPALENFEVVEG